MFDEGRFWPAPATWRQRLGMAFRMALVFEVIVVLVKAIEPIQDCFIADDRLTQRVIDITHHVASCVGQLILVEHKVAYMFF